MLSRTQSVFSSWQGAKLPQADVRQADFTSANLKGAYLSALQASGAHWYKTNLTEAIQEGLLSEQTRQTKAAEQQFQMRRQEMDEQISMTEKTLSPMQAQLEGLEAE